MEWRGAIWQIQMPLHLGRGRGFMLREDLIVHLGCKHYPVAAHTMSQCCFSESLERLIPAVLVTLTPLPLG